MRLRTVCWLLSGLLVLAGFSTTSHAQGVRIPEAAIEAPAVNLNQVLAEGQALEQGGRWGEAIGHYERALKENPGSPVLTERLDVAKGHYDLSRRYHDQSFTGFVTDMSEREAIDLYTEVLVKVQTHYVHEPNWSELVAKGTKRFELALRDSDFQAFHRADLKLDGIDAFLKNLNYYLAQRSVTDRSEAREAVWFAAQYGRQQIGVSPQSAMLEYACGLTNTLDDYSSFLTPAQLAEVYSQIEGNFVGLGVELKAEGNALLIVHVIPGGPAAEAGVQAGETIVGVDGRATTELDPDRAADLLRGEEGTSVEVALAKNGRVRKLTMTRRRVEVPSVIDVKLVDPQQGIGYLKLTSFQKTTSRDIDAALWKLHRQGMKSLIFDVRGNPGGLLTSSVEVADKFVAAGAIVSTRGRSAREDFDYKAHNFGTWRVPLVVLIDNDSASASEIFAGAIRDHRRGTIVGERSYGKGSVQGIFPLAFSKAGVRLTTAKFYSPSGQPISKRGVTPDVVIHRAAKPTDGQLAGGDAVLRAAIRAATDQLGSTVTQNRPAF